MRLTLRIADTARARDLPAQTIVCIAKKAQTLAEALDAAGDLTYKLPIMSSIATCNLCKRTGGMCAVALITRQRRLPRAGNGPG